MAENSKRESRQNGPLVKILFNLPYKGIVFILSDRWQVSLWKENVNHQF